MRFLTIIYALTFLIPINAHAYKVLVVGDSISAAYGLAEDDGWVALAEAKLQEVNPDVSFINASISGDTTGGGLRRLPAALDRFEPDLVVIELGGNDGLRGYPPATMQQNLESMATLAVDAGADVLFLGMQIPTNYGEAYLRLFSSAFEQAAKNTESELLPFFLEPIATERDYFQRDGIHPTAEAQPLLLEHVLPLLESFITNESTPKVTDKEAL